MKKTAKNAKKTLPKKTVAKRVAQKKVKPQSKTNWDKLKSLTDKELLLAAKGDPDAQPTSKSELKNFKRVNPPETVNVAEIRRKTHLTQALFAKYFGVNIRTIQDWEQGRRKPSATARNFLKVIELEPKAVQRALISHHHSTH